MVFGVKLRGNDIFDEPTLKSGITVGSPIFEWALSCQWWGLQWSDFNELPGEEKEFLVAVYRTQRQMEAVLAYQQHKEMRKKK